MRAVQRAEHRAAPPHGHIAAIAVSGAVEVVALRERIAPIPFVQWPRWDDHQGDRREGDPVDVADDQSVEAGIGFSDSAKVQGGTGRPGNIRPLVLPLKGEWRIAGPIW